MVTHILAILSLTLFLVLAGLAILFIAYARKTNANKSEIIDKSLLEKDGLIKENIVLKEENRNLKNQTASLNNALSDVNVLAEKLREENKNLIAKNSESAADNKNLREIIHNQKTDFENRLIKQKQEFQESKDIFENLSSKILEEKSKKFLETNKDSISGILNPLSEKILEFQRKVEETYDKESKQRFSLQTEISKLRDAEKTMEQTTNNLTTALKGTAKIQGDWGEMILEKLLEHSGLIKGINYEIQKTIKTTDEMDEKISLRPDVIVHLPQDRDLIVDSKVSLTDYERYMSLLNGEINGGSNNGDNYRENSLNINGDNDVRDKFLKAHVNSIKKHINEISDKKYSNLLGAKSLDAVVMFIPIEFAYTAAINYDRDIITYAYSRNVIIATPSIIMLILNIVSNLWIQEKSKEKNFEVLFLAGQLYDKFCSFSKSIEEIGYSLDKTATAYDNARKQLDSGKGNLMSRFERIKQLGAKTAKSLDRNKFEHEEYQERELEKIDSEADLSE